MKKYIIALMAIGLMAGQSLMAQNLLTFANDFATFPDGQEGPDGTTDVPNSLGDGTIGALVQLVLAGDQVSRATNAPTLGGTGLTGGDTLISPVQSGGTATWYGNGAGDIPFFADAADGTVSGWNPTDWIYVRVYDRPGTGGSGTGNQPGEMDYSGDAGVVANYPAAASFQGVFYYDYPIQQAVSIGGPNFAYGGAAGVAPFNGNTEWNFIQGTPLAVPEPSTVGLILAGLFGLRIIRRRK